MATVPHRERLWGLAAIGSIALVVSVPASAQPSETAVKAAFLAKFLRYVNWPPAAHPARGQPYIMCVIGRDPFGRLLDQAAAGETVDGNPIVVRRLTTAQDPSGCHTAFVAGDGSVGTARMLASLREHATLTITDGRMGPKRGMIHFAIVDDRVRFHVDDVEAGRRGLSISSRLLSIAASVRSRG